MENKDMEWHDAYQDPIIGGLNVGKFGAMKYILDSPGGKKISRGYHSFWMHEGSLMGSIGSRTERVCCERHYEPTLKDQDMSQTVENINPVCNDLTKREYAAIKAMQGMLAGGEQFYPDVAVEIADALLAELDKEKEG
jgi:hypothetical protein